MWIVACGTGAGGNGAVNVCAIEGLLIVTTGTESVEVFTVFQKETAISTVGLVTSQTVAVLDRGMDDRSFAGGFMAGGAQLLSLSDQ